MIKEKDPLSLLKSIISQAGGLTALGRVLKCHPQAIYKWKKGLIKIPLKHVYSLTLISDLTIEDLRPDLKVNFLTKNINKQVDI